MDLLNAPDEVNKPVDIATPKKVTIRIVRPKKNLDFFNSDIPVIDISESPPEGSWLLTPLYHLDACQEIRIWQIGFDAVNSYLKTKSGMVRTGGFTYASLEIKVNKSGRDLLSQALLQAKKKYMDKYIQDMYRPTLCMDPEGLSLRASTGYPFNAAKVRRYPVAVQAKLDGFRMLCHEIQGKINKRSRENRPFNHITHFDDELAVLFRYLPPGSILDGEMYNLNYQHNQISSIVTTKKDGPHELLPTVKYNIFDVYFPQNPPYEYRYNTLLNAFEKYLQDGFANTTFEVLACNLCYSEDEVDEMTKYFIDQGFEGMIVRQLAGENPTQQDIDISVYQQKRSFGILKCKIFIDEESTVVGIYEGEGIEKGKILFQVGTPDGKVFGVRPRGSHEEREKMFQMGESSFIGRMYTYRYHTLTEYGIPRFPVGLGFRDYMD